MQHETTSAMEHETSSPMAHETTKAAAVAKHETTPEMKHEATSTAAAVHQTTTTAAAAHQTTTYGSGKVDKGNSYDACVQQCMAQQKATLHENTKAELETKTEVAAAAKETGKVEDGLKRNAAGELVAGPHEVIVAPKQGVLRMVPFALDAPTGTKIKFIWGAGPHTVTQSSALTICNKTTAPDAFASGVQNVSFTFPVEVKDASKPIWHFCGVAKHCLSGMFGGINIPKATEAKAGAGEYISQLASKDREFAKLLNETDVATAASPAAKRWGSSYSFAEVPEEMRADAARNILWTRQFYATNPDLLQANTAGASSAPASNGGPVATSASGADANSNAAAASTDASTDASSAESALDQNTPGYGSAGALRTSGAALLVALVGTVLFA